MEMTTAKTIAVFCIIFGCFAILYPKIFHPMFLHLLGLGPDKPKHDDMMSKMPPHLKKGPGGGHPIHSADSHMNMRAGPHPGLRAAAELKKQAAQTGRDGGGGKGMMGVVLPMYAVGIVIYLVYTLSKVFGKGKEKEVPTPDYLGGNNPFKDIRYDAEEKKFMQSRNFEAEDLRDNLRGLSQSKQKQRDLERLLLKADERNISEREMMLLKQRLLETENQMTRILQAMEAVQTNIATIPDNKAPNPPTEKKEGNTVDSSPDMDSYEVISGKSNASSPSIEDLGAVGGPLYDQMSAENDLSRESDQGVASFDMNLSVGEDEGQAFNEIEGDKHDFDADEEEEVEQQDEQDEEEAGNDDETGDEEYSEEEEEIEEEEDDDEDNVEVTLKDNVEHCDDEHPDLRQRLPPNSKTKGEHRA